MDLDLTLLISFEVLSSSEVKGEDGDASQLLEAEDAFKTRSLESTLDGKLLKRQ